MKREVLKSLELTDEVIDKIMTEHGNSTNSLKKQIADLEGQVATYKGRVSERDKQLDELKKSAGDSEKLQNQIAKLQEENKKAAAEYDANLKQIKLDNAVDMALTNAKAKNVKAVKALINLDAVKMDGDTLIGLNDQITKLVESDPYMFHVEQKPAIDGAKPAKGNGSNDAPKPGSYEYFKMLDESGQL